MGDLEVLESRPAGVTSDVQNEDQNRQRNQASGGDKGGGRFSQPILDSARRKSSWCPPIPEMGMASPTLKKGDHPPSEDIKIAGKLPPINSYQSSNESQGDLPVQAGDVKKVNRSRMRRLSMEIIDQVSHVATTVKRAVGMEKVAEPRVGSPRSRAGTKGRAVGGAVHAFLTMVPGGTGDSITRPQYMGLLQEDFKRLKLGDIRVPLHDIVDAVFEDHQVLDLKTFENVVDKIKLPTGKLASASNSGMPTRITELGRTDSFMHRDKDITDKTAWGKLKGKMRRFWDDNGTNFCAAIYALVNIALFIEVIASRNGWLPGSTASPRVGAANGALIDLARGFGMLCNFNCAFILVPMMRTIITRLQSTWVSGFIPLDKAYDFHQVVALWAFVFGCLHGLSHVINLIMWDGWFWHGTLWCGTVDDTFLQCSAVTGIFAIITMSLIVGFSHSYFRKSKRFNTFWMVHHLGPLFYVIMLFHGRNFWKWFLPCIVGYIVDRINRKKNATFVSQVIATAHKDQGVIQVQFTKPWSINHMPGQYVFIKSPCISKFEYHPFTVTSSPEDDYLECHIKSVGDWTGDFFRDYSPSNIEDGKPVYIQPKMNLTIDGPHGAPSQDWTQYETIVLISAGIGVTPFASIIKYIRDRIRQRNVLIAAGLKVPRVLDLQVKKVHFFWVCRDQGSFQWFTEMIRDTQKELGDMLEVHIYLSSVDALGDVRAVMTHIGLHSYFHTHKIDAITSLPSITHYDRPNWSKIFKLLASQHENERVGVFFCGPHSLGVSLGKHCANCSTPRTTLVFAKENF